MLHVILNTHNNLAAHFARQRVLVIVLSAHWMCGLDKGLLALPLKLLTYYAFLYRILK